MPFLSARPAALGRRLSCFALLLVAACSSPTALQRPDTTFDPPDADGFRVVGYHPWWMEGAWEGYDLAVLQEVLFFEVELSADGSVGGRNGWPARWSPMLQRLTGEGVHVVPTVTLFDTDAFTQLFADPEAVARLRGELATLATAPGVSGLHLDVEIFDPVPPAVRAAYTAFVHALRADLDALGPGYRLSMYALAMDPADAYDEAGLAPAVDYFVVQGYDLHWQGDTQAGPVAGLRGWGTRNWHHVMNRFLALGVPRKKMVMAVPYYGFEWPTEHDAPGARTRGPAEVLTYAPVMGNHPGAFASARDRAVQHGLRRDPVSGSPYYAYQDTTGWHQGWFEDAASLAAKYAFVKEQGLGGVAVFPLAYGDAVLDAALRDAFATPPALAARP